jgi:endonuclease G
MKTLQKKVFLFSVFLQCLAFQNIAFAKIETVLGSSLDKNSGLVLQLPETTAPEIILSRPQYVLSYNKDRRAPNWVSWKLETKNLGEIDRSNNFALDTELQSYLEKSEGNKPAVDITDYKGSCYDRGHQIPSADRTSTLADNEATFLMSNMIPQTAYMNRVVWEHLEAYSRGLLRQGKKLYIIAGPVYDKNFGMIGPQKDIPVPSKNFKIIFVLDSNQNFGDINAKTETIAVLMPNMLQDGSTPDKNPEGLCAQIDTRNEDKTDWEKYKTSVDEIQKISGLTFSYLQNKTDAVSE